MNSELFLDWRIDRNAALELSLRVDAYCHWQSMYLLRMPIFISCFHWTFMICIVTYIVISQSLTLIALHSFIVEYNHYNRWHYHLELLSRFLRWFYDSCCISHPFFSLSLPCHAILITLPLFILSFPLLFSFGILLKSVIIYFVMPHIQPLVISVLSDIGNTITMTAAMSYV